MMVCPSINDLFRPRNSVIKPFSKILIITTICILLTGIELNNLSNNSERISKRFQKDFEKDAKKDAKKDSKRISERIPKRIPKRIPERIPKRIPKRIPERISEGRLKEFLKEFLKELSKEFKSNSKRTPKEFLEEFFEEFWKCFNRVLKESFKNATLLSQEVCSSSRTSFNVVVFGEEYTTAAVVEKARDEPILMELTITMIKAKTYIGKRNQVFNVM